MITEEIKIVPEYWESNPSDIRYNYVSPEGYLANVSGIVGKMVQTWSINAWGRFINEAIDLYRFKATYREHKTA
jgi:hypothetical protein